MSGAMEKIKAKVENVLHKDKDTTHDTTHTGTTGTHTGTTGTHTSGSGLTGSTHNDPTGPHSSHVANQADPRVDSDRYGAAGNTIGAGQYGTTGTHGTTSSGLPGSHGTTTGSGLTGSNTYGSNTHGTTGTGLTGHSTAHGSDPTGPHDSKLANKLDPRVDSDRVGPAGNSSSIGGYGNETHSSGAGLTRAHHADTHSHSTHGSDPTGPHDSKLANKLDPRVDSDRYGAAGNTSGAGGYGSTGSGLTGHNTSTHTGTHTGSHIGSDPTGPHNTHLANQADPRVDSDRYGAAGNTSGAGGYGTTGSGLTGHNTTGSGFTGSSGYTDPSGPHDSRLGNRVDPRVDSNQYGGQGNTYGTTQGSGLTGNNHPGHVGNNDANKTAGPHGSNLLNKLDPRVDSDLDGSKTTGGDRTYG